MINKKLHTSMTDSAIISVSMLSLLLLAGCAGSMASVSDQQRPPQQAEEVIAEEDLLITPEEVITSEDAMPEEEAMTALSDNPYWSKTKITPTSINNSGRKPDAVKYSKINVGANLRDVSMHAPDVEVVFDKTTHILSCGFFNHEFKIPVAKTITEKNFKDNPTVGNFYVPIHNIVSFKKSYNVYQNSFNNHVYDCGKSTTVKGKQQREGSTVVISELSETFNPKNCGKFDYTPIQVSYTKWLDGDARLKLEDKALLYNKGIITIDDVNLTVEYSPKGFSKMMSVFKVKVDDYNNEKTGDLFGVDKTNMCAVADK